MENRKYTVGPDSMGESKLLGKPTTKIGFEIKNNAITTQKINDKAVTPEKLSERVVTEIFNPMIEDLKNQIDSAGKHGVAVSNEFGDDTYISVSQKTLTNAFNKIWSKIEDMTGEHTQGIRMSVTPDYFISEDGADVSINAYTVETNGIFEHIAFYANGTLIAEADNVETFSYKETFGHDYHIKDTTLIKCIAKIMGIEYTEQKVVTRYDSFWLGAGATYEYVMDNYTPKPIGHGMKGNYPVDCEQGDYLFVIVEKSLSKEYIRIDMNGFEIPTESKEVTIGEDKYYVFKSENAYQAGTYNIDINS